MKLKFFFTFTFALLSFMLITQVHAQFRWTAGGANNEEANTIIKTPDGGYAVAGITSTYGMVGTNMYVLKFSASGTLQWSKSIGGAGTDAAGSIIRTTDGGYAVAGNTNSFGAGANDMYIVKLDASGNVTWSKVIGGPEDDYAWSIIQTTDGGYAVSGTTKSFGAGNGDFHLVKLSSTGSVQWSRRTGGAADEIGSSLIQTSDGGYIMTGSTISYGAGYYDVFVVKYNSSGIPLWGRAVGGSDGEFGLSIHEVSDGGFVIGGSTNSFGAGYNDLYVFKLSSGGALLWTRTVGGDNYEYGRGMVQAADGGFVIAGATGSFGASGDDVFIVKLSSAGVPQWQRRVGGGYDDFGTSIALSSDGYAVAGYTKSYGAGMSDFFICKFDLNGSICGSNSTPNITSGSGGSIVSFLPTSFPTGPGSVSPAAIIVPGGTVSALCLTAVEPGGNELPKEFALRQNYPNPFNPSTTINYQLAMNSEVKLAVYDILGKEIAVLVDNTQNAGSYSIEWNASNYPSGVYFYTLKTDNFVETKKMILTK